MKCSVKNVCLGKNRREKGGERKWEENKKGKKGRENVEGNGICKTDQYPCPRELVALHPWMGMMKMLSSLELH